MFFTLMYFETSFTFTLYYFQLMEIFTSHMASCIRHRIQMSALKRFASSLASSTTAVRQPLVCSSHRSHLYCCRDFRHQPTALVHSSAPLYAGKKKNTKKKIVGVFVPKLDCDQHFRPCPVIHLPGNLFDMYVLLRLVIWTFCSSGCGMVLFLILLLL